MAASAISTGGLIDPTKQAEYPVVLGDRLAGRESNSNSQLINIQYNYKTKSATAQQRSKITRSLKSRDLYNLTISDKAPNAERNPLTYSYQGSVDPDQAESGSDEHNLVLVFDADRKAFVLDSVATQLNFNLRSAPVKTEKQVIEQYTQLRTLHEDDQHGPSDDRTSDNGGNDEGPADESNPYDWRHFLPKDNDDDKSVSDHDHPASDAHSTTSKANTPLMPAVAKPPPTSKPRSKPQANPLRQKKREPVKEPKSSTAKPAPAPAPAPAPTKTPTPAPTAPVDEEVEESKPSPSDTGSAAVSSQKTVPSPGSNIIIDGDLIIDMGSPPPSRPTFNINPAHFSSNNTPANGAEDEEDYDEEMEDLRLPSPAGRREPAPPKPMTTATAASDGEDDDDDDDPLAAEMEAAFEESAREEEQAQGHHYQAPSRQYNVPSDDESEVSEEE